MLALATPAARTDSARGARQCPAVKVSCADTAICGSELTFTAEVSDAAASAKLSYNWTVAAGTIASGQGASSIKVDTTGFCCRPLEATVQVTGLPEACAGKATCATNFICDPMPRKFGEYENIRFNDEKTRLDSFAASLHNDPTAQGYLLCYGGKVGRAGEAQARCERAKNYLVTKHGFDIREIVTVDGGYKESLTMELWIVPSGVFPPTASPTVDPGEVRFTKGKPKVKAHHR